MSVLAAVDWTGAFGEVLDHRLVEVSGTTVTVATAATAVLVVLVSLWLSRLARSGLRRVLQARGAQDEHAFGTLATLLHWIILFSGFGMALDTVGIDLAALFAAGAIFAIGLGFAMQNIAQNFVSGVILLTEQAIKPGHVIEVEGNVCRVLRLGIRATIVQTRDGEAIIVPNSILAQSAVKNYTLDNSQYRLKAVVGVVYASDMDQVRQLLVDCGDAVEWRNKDIEPQVLLVDFGDNAVIWELAVWMDDPWRARMAKSKLNQAIWDSFKAAEVVIAFPQVDVHFDEPVAKGLARLAGA